MKCIVCGVEADADFCSNECFDTHQTSLYMTEQEEVAELERMWAL